MSTRPFGLPGLEIQPCDHICAFFRGPDERDGLLFPFLAAGLEDHEKCLCLVDTLTPEDVRAGLAGIVPRQDDDQLVALSSTDSYNPPEGFLPETMTALLAARVSHALDDEGYEFVRTVGEMTSTLTGQMDRAQLLAYEMAINEFLPRHPQVALCLYDVDRFDGGTILDMIRVHPKMLLNGELVENPYYLR